MEFLYLSRQDRKGIIDAFGSDNDILKERVRKKLSEHIIKSLVFNNVPITEIDNILSTCLSFTDEVKGMMSKRDFRTRVMKKDGHLCKLCGSGNTKPHVHRIKAIEFHPELKYDINNTIVLCEKCHKLIHNNEYRNRVSYLLEHTNFNTDKIPTEFPYESEVGSMSGK